MWLQVEANASFDAIGGALATAAIMSYGSVDASIAMTQRDENALKEELQQDLILQVCALVYGCIFLVIAACFFPRRSTSEAPESKSEEEAEEDQVVSLWRIWVVTAMNVPFGFSVTIVGLLMAPLEAKRLWPDSSSMGMGMLAVLAGLSQLAAPAAGYASDIYRSALGRRRPMVMMSVALGCTFTLGSWIFSLQKKRIAFAASFGLQQLMLSITLSAQAGLVPDLIPMRQHSIAGAAGAANALLGAVGACVYIVASASRKDYHQAYTGIVSCMTGFCVIVCIFSHEQPSFHIGTVPTEAPNDPNTTESSSLRKIAGLYVFDVRAHVDFFILLILKSVYSASIGGKAFLLFFLRDTFRHLSSTWHETMLAHIAAVVEIAAALAALALFLRPRTSQWNLWYLRIGSGFMSVLWLFPAVIALAQHDREGTEDTDNEFAALWVPRMHVCMAAWGISHGIYMVGDQATQLALLPDQSQAARYLGFSSICACVGGVVGGVTFAVLLAGFASTSPVPGFTGKVETFGYSYKAYVALFICCSLFNGIITALALKIKVPHSADAG